MFPYGIIFKRGEGTKTGGSLQFNAVLKKIRKIERLLFLIALVHHAGPGESMRKPGKLLQI